MTTRTHALTTTALLPVLLPVLLAVLLLGGCGAEQQQTATEPTEDTMSSTSPAPGADSPAARAATASLAGRLGMGEDEVVVTSVEEVTWKDGSLGCAEQGTMYTQALVDGQRIVLEAGGDTYEFHAGADREPFLCEEPTE